MDFAQERELVHLRYELRRLLADGRREEAAPLLERLRQIASGSVGERPLEAHIHPDARPLHFEIARWASTFGL